MSTNEEHKKQSSTRDPDLANAEIALRRAAGKAREVARQTGTLVVYSINGKLVKESPFDKSHIDGQ